MNCYLDNNIYSIYPYCGDNIQEVICNMYSKIEELKANGQVFDVEEFEKLKKLVPTYPTTALECGVKFECYPYGDIRRYGAVEGSGMSTAQKGINADAIQNAINSTNGSWGGNHEVIIPSGVWEYNKEIKINKTFLTFRGINNRGSILKPDGCNGIHVVNPNPKPGVRLQAIVIKDLMIHGGLTGIIGDGLSLECSIENVVIEYCTGEGFVATGVYDFKVDRLHVRNTGGLGIHIIQPEGEGTWREVSYIPFTFCSVVECNSNRTQWKLEGNNIWLSHCKAIGNVGVEFVGNSWNCTVKDFYFDGKGGDSIVIKANGHNIRYLDVENVYGWNHGIVLDIADARSVNIRNLCNNPSNWASTHVQMESTFGGVVHMDSKKYNIVDKRADKKDVRIIRGAGQGKPFIIRSFQKDFNFHRGGKTFTIDTPSGGQEFEKIVSVHVTPMGEYEYKARGDGNVPAGATLTPTFWASTNNKGWYEVHGYCAGVCDTVDGIKGKVMITIVSEDNLDEVQGNM